MIKIPALAAAAGLAATLAFYPLHAHAQNGQVFAAVQKDGKWGYIDTLGKVQIPFNLEAATSFREGKAAVKYGKIWGYINKKGTFVLKPVFLTARPYYDSHATISFYDSKDSARYRGIINRYGTMVTVLEDYESASDFHDGYVKIISQDVNGSAIGYKDSADNWAIKPHYDGATDFHEGKAAVQLGRLWGFIDQKNEYLVFPKYSEAWYYQEGLAYVKDTFNKISYLNDKGKPAFTVNYEEVDLLMQDGMISFRDKGKIGFMNKKGKVVIKPEFNGKFLTRFQDGLCPIEGPNGKYGYINKKGKFVIEPQFDDAQLFFNNLAAVKVNGKYGYINKKGQFVVEPQYENVMEFEPADTFIY